MQRSLSFCSEMMSLIRYDLKVNVSASAKLVENGDLYI